MGKLSHHAILTISIGDKYNELAKITHPIIQKYADKIEAKFIKITKQQISQTTHHWEKFQIYNLLNKYHRIIYIDTDIIIRDDCPNLFDIVPENKFGAFNEGAFSDRSEAIKIIQQQYNTELNWNGEYYNTGVMIISRIHKFLFAKPPFEASNFFEQTYINLILQKTKTEIHQLPYKYNRMTILDAPTGESRLASYIIHYAGCPDISLTKELMQKDIKQWTENQQYDYKRNIDIQVHGGLGDEICAEPVIRYIIEHAYPDANITITTWYPRLFIHLPVPVYQMGEFKYKNDTAYYRMDTMAKHNDLSWKFISPNLLHGVDYSSIMCLRGIIPNEHKRIKLKITNEDIAEVEKIIGKINDNTILVHPGKGWPSKTFPAQYWKEIIDKLATQSQIIIIGKDISDEQGAITFDTPSNVINTINLLSIGGLIYLISRGKILISNDSAPIHIAGAFDNHIILIPTCKHPDHVLPYRQCDKSIALYKKLTCDAINSTPTNVHGQTIDYVVGDIMDYLPDTDIIVNEAIKRSTH